MKTKKTEINLSQKDQDFIKDQVLNLYNEYVKNVKTLKEKVIEEATKREEAELLKKKEKMERKKEYDRQWIIQRRKNIKAFYSNSKNAPKIELVKKLKENFNEIESLKISKNKKTIMVKELKKIILNVELQKI